MIEGRGLQGDEPRAERRGLDNHRVLAQVQQREDVERVVARSRDAADRGVQQALGVMGLVPAAGGEEIL